MAKRKGGIGRATKWLVGWHQLVRDKVEGATVKHFTAEVLHLLLCCGEVEVAKHFVRTPPTQEGDMTIIHIRTK
jgi:hypothetical protein